MENRFNFKSIFIAIVLIGFTTTASIAVIGSGLNLLNGDLSLQEQTELDNISSSQYQSIGIYSGETKLISFPRKMETITFSEDSGFSIRTLIGGEWIDMSNNPDDYEVMQGYIVRNFGSENIYIQVKYTAITSADQTLYQKELKAGWNLYAPVTKNDYCNAANLGDSLNGTNYSQIIDFSTMGFKKNFSNEVSIDHIYSGETLFFNKESGHPQEFREDGNYTIKNSGDVSKDFIYEGGAYGIFVNNDTLVSGHQNITDNSGRELIKYNNHPVIVFKDNLNTELNISDKVETELLNFDFTSKFNGTDDDGTSSILATLSLIGTVNNAGKITDNFNDIKVKIDGVEKSFSMNSCNMLGDISKCNYGNLYLHFDEPQLITRGHTVNVSVLATPKNNIKFENYNIKLDKGNTLILDDQNLLPYCNDDGFILGTIGYQGRNINIDTTSNGGGGSYSADEIMAANNLAAKGIINSQSDPNDYNLGSSITKAEFSIITANIAGISANNSCENIFSDVSSTIPNSWACGYIEALVSQGIYSTGSTEFNPLANISKAEVIKITMIAGGKVVNYTEETWKEDFVNYAVTNGFVSSFDDYNSDADRGFYFSVAAAMLSEESEGDILGELDCLLGGNCDNGTGSTNTGTTLESPINIQLLDSSTGSLSISWDVVTGAESYNTYITKKSEDDILSNLDLLLLSGSVSNENTFIFENLESGTTYLMMVNANDSDGEKGANSNIVEFSTILGDDGSTGTGETNTGTLLDAPTNVVLLNSSTGSLNINWGTDENAFGYHIYYSKTPSVDIQTAYKKEYITENPLLIDQLEADTQYYFIISAFNDIGEESLFSDEVMFKTDTEVISTGELNISYDTNTQTNSNDKIILAGDFNDILSLDVNVVNEDIVVGTIEFTTSQDLTNVIDTVKLLILGEGTDGPIGIVTTDKITFNNVNIQAVDNEFILRITTNNIGNDNIGELINNAQITGVNFQDISGLDSNDIIENKTLSFTSANFDIQQVLVVPSINKSLNTGLAELKIMTDIGTNDSSLIELTSLNFATPGATEGKKYRIINPESSGSGVTASVSNGSINFNISNNVNFNITIDGTYSITPENMIAEETAALELQSIDYMIGVENFTKILENPLDFGSFTY